MLADQIVAREQNQADGQVISARPRIPARKRREAPACMRCRGLTGSQQATDLPIPQRIRALPDRHLVNSPYAIPGPPASRKLSGLPPRGLAVQVVNDFLLRPPTGTQGLSDNLSKILFSSTVWRLLSPAIGAYPPGTHSFCTAAGKRRAGGRGRARAPPRRGGGSWRRAPTLSSLRRARGRPGRAAQPIRSS